MSGKSFFRSISLSFSHNHATLLEAHDRFHSRWATLQTWHFFIIIINVNFLLGYVDAFLDLHGIRVFNGTGYSGTMHLYNTDQSFILFYFFKHFFLCHSSIQPITRTCLPILLWTFTTTAGALWNATATTTWQNQLSASVGNSSKIQQQQQTFYNKIDALNLNSLSMCVIKQVLTDF